MLCLTSCPNARVPACSLHYKLDVYICNMTSRCVCEERGMGRKEGGGGAWERKEIVESICSDRDLEKGTLDVGMVWRNLSIRSHPCLCTFLGIPTSPFTF